MEQLIRDLIQQAATELGTYTYIRIVKIFVSQLEQNIPGLAPQVFGQDLVWLSDDTVILTDLPQDDQDAVNALVALVNVLLTTSGIQLTLADLKPVLLVWGQHIVADFGTT